MNNKGFAISGMIYSIMLVFLVFLTVMLFNLQDRKTVLDEIKTDAVKAVESSNNLESLEVRIEALEDPSAVFLKAHPVGSIYVTVATDESTVEKMQAKYTDSTWEVYGQGRVLVGTGSNGTTSYNSVNATGGSETNSTTLTIANLPTHTHSISHTHTTPVTSLTNGSTSSAGEHYHNMYMFMLQSGYGSAISANSYYYNTTSGNFVHTTSNIADQNRVWMGQTSTTPSHTHTVTGTIPSMTTDSQSTTNSGTAGSNSAFTTSTVQPYVTVYMYKRIS